MRPMLKTFAVYRNGSALRLDREAGRGFEFDDESGVIEAAVRIMDGTRTVGQIAGELAPSWPEATEDALGELIAAMDAEALIEDAAAASAVPAAEQRRYASNLAFFSTFATLEASRHDFQARLRAAHVLQLGAGGVGSDLLLGLVGSGVGRITLVDHDRVELKNLVRQFVYTEADVGQAKVARAAARARALNSTVTVEAVELRVGGPSDVADLLPGVDLVLSSIDRPLGVGIWVSDACAAAGVPMIAGGSMATRMVYWSMWPGHSGCARCWHPDFEPGSDDVPADLASWPNRTMGPMASLAAGLMGMEALRYLTGYAAPVSAGRAWFIDLVTGACAIEDTWARRPDCAVCPPETDAEPGRANRTAIGSPV